MHWRECVELARVAVIPAGRVTVNVWTDGWASLVIVTVPVAALPRLSETVRMQDVPAGIVLPQFPTFSPGPRPQ